MARVCAICDKRVTSGNNVSHSKRRTKRTVAPNLQNVRAVVDQQTVRLRVCTRCLRSGKVQRAV